MSTSSRARRRPAPGHGPTVSAGDRPRILVVHPGAELYGADRVLLESVAALAGTFEVTVALPGRGPLVAALEEHGARVVTCPMPVLRRAALRPRGLARLVTDAVRGLLPAIRLLRRYGTAGVYVNTLTLPSWPLLARLTGRKTLCHVHEAERSAPWLLRRGMAVCPSSSDRVVVNSRFTLDVLTDVAPRLRARSAVVHNAVTGPAEAVAARPAVTDAVQLLYVGRLSPRKGPQVAVATLAELVRRRIDARLTVVGSVFEGYEWFAEELQDRVVATGLVDRVHFAGFQPDVWPYLAAADVVLVPSVAEESFGNAAIEAVMAARPLLVSDHSGLREAVAGYGSVQALDPDRTADWADAVERVVARWPELRRTALRDAADARQRHSRDRYRTELVAQVAMLSEVHDPGPGEPAPAAGAGRAQG